ncbi:MAG: hypothetical protein H0V17_24425, partial [Deltaproteobacteria bacterium]|nr:hypothetical protein [Deltaproteobacteria bacterium]
MLYLGIMRELVIASLISLTGCIAAEGADTDPDPADPTDPTDPTDPVPPPSADGTYQVRSQYDVTAEAVLPEPAFQLVDTLSSFSTAPAHTLLDVAEDAGVPAVGTLRD